MIRIVERKHSAPTRRHTEGKNSARRVTQDFLQELIDTKVAKDISDDAEDYVNQNLRKIYFSTGDNGIDGAGFIDEDGKMYVIIGMNSVTYKLFSNE